MASDGVLHRLIQGYRAFRTRVVLRVAFLGATLWLLFYIIVVERMNHPAVPIVVGFVLLYQLYSLVHYVERTNRDLARFLAAIRYADFSQTFVTGGLGSSFDELKTAFNEVLDAFRQARAEKEEQGRYLANRGAAHWRRLDCLRQRWRGVAGSTTRPSAFWGCPAWATLPISTASIPS